MRKFIDALDRGCRNLGAYGMRPDGFAIMLFLVLSLGVGCGALYGLLTMSMAAVATAERTTDQALETIRQLQSRNTKLQVLHDKLVNEVVTLREERTTRDAVVGRTNTPRTAGAAPVSATEVLVAVVGGLLLLYLCVRLLSTARSLKRVAKPCKVTPSTCSSPTGCTPSS